MLEGDMPAYVGVIWHGTAGLVAVARAGNDDKRLLVKNVHSGQ
jgi:hypothetical protein